MKPTLRARSLTFPAALLGALLSSGCMAGADSTERAGAVEGGTFEDGAPDVGLGTAEGALFELVQIKPRHSGKCLDVEYASTEDEAELIQYTCHGGDNQRFEVVPLGDGDYAFVARHSGKCLDVEYASMEDEANIIQYSCHFGDNQRFAITNQYGTYHRIIAKHSGKCLDVEYASMEDEANIIQYSCHGGYNQQFSFD